jgi:TIR domain
MATILCIDTDPATAEALRAAGHRISVGTLGYTDGRPRLATPPHEVDLIVCDLRAPACFDATRWGPLGNSNSQCTIVQNPRVAWVNQGGAVLPHFRMIQTSQMKDAQPRSFGPDDVYTAISRAGVPFVLMLNPDWLHHQVSWEPLNICGLIWRLSPTKADKVEIREPLRSEFPEIDREIRLDRPLLYAIDEGPLNRATGKPDPFVKTRIVVTNAIGQQFGHVLELGKGIIWALPKLEANAKWLSLAVSRLDRLNLKTVGGPSPAEAAPTVPSPTDRDVFISHASEDKVDVARPLVDALTRERLTVWFDEYELRLGDRLRQRIEDGLKRSRFGVVIMSHSFFAKRWPQLELDGLFALEVGEKRILPVWHGLTADDVRQYSPILSERLAVSTSRGMDEVVRKIVAAVRAPKAS